MELKHGFIIAILSLVGTALWFVLPLEFQFLAVIIILSATMLSGWYLIDKYVLTNIDTQHEIRSNNIAVGMFFIGYVLIFGISCLSAFAVFFTLK